jgi:hypothetical protein
LPGLVNVWKAASDGPEVDYFVPLLRSNDAPAGPGIVAIPLFRSAFGPFVYPAQGPFAFRPLSEVPRFDTSGHEIAEPTLEGVTWTRIRANAGPARTLAAESAQLAGKLAALKSNGIPLDQWSGMTPDQQAAARAAGFFPQTIPGGAASAATSPAKMSTGKKVAIGAGVATVTLGGLWWAFGQPLSMAALKSAWGSAR